MTVQTLGDKTLADCVEALVGAAFVSGGVVMAKALMAWLGLPSNLTLARKGSRSGPTPVPSDPLYEQVKFSFQFPISQEREVAYRRSRGLYTIDRYRSARLLLMNEVKEVRKRLENTTHEGQKLRNRLSKDVERLKDLEVRLRAAQAEQQIGGSELAPELVPQLVHRFTTLLHQIGQSQRTLDANTAAGIVLLQDLKRLEDEVRTIDRMREHTERNDLVLAMSSVSSSPRPGHYGREPFSVIRAHRHPDQKFMHLLMNMGEWEVRFAASTHAKNRDDWVTCFATSNGWCKR
jgi:hypothetical protein